MATGQTEDLYGCTRQQLLKQPVAALTARPDGPPSSSVECFDETWRGVMGVGVKLHTGGGDGAEFHVVARLSVR